MGLLAAIADVIIVGGSHAGLAAALSLYRAQHTCLIFDCQRPRNVSSNPTRLVSTWDNEDTRKMKEASKAELLRSGYIKFVDSEMVAIERTKENHFRVADMASNQWLGRKLLLTIGAQDVFPQLRGYEELYAKRIFPCMFQFGLEQRGCASAGLLALEGLANVYFASLIADDANKFAEHVTIYTDGNPTLATQLASSLQAPTVSVDDRKIQRLERGADGSSEVTIHFGGNDQWTEGFLVHRPLTKIDRTFVDQLGLEMSERGDIKVQAPFCQTSLPGVYAAGDCASPMKVIPNAASMGAYAACGLARELPRRVTGNPTMVRRLT